MELLMTVGLTLTLVAGIWFTRRLMAGNRTSLDELRRRYAAADGVVGRITVRGAIGEPITTVPEFQRFHTWDSEAELEPEDSTNHAELPPGLFGQVALVPIFLGVEAQRWHDRDLARILKTVIAASEWIEAQAIARQIPVNLDLSRTVFVWDETVAADRSDAMRAWGVEPDGSLHEFPEGVDRTLEHLRLALKGEGLGDPVAFAARLRNRINADVVLLVLVPDRLGRSYAMVDRPPLAIRGVSYIVCYPGYAPLEDTRRGPVNLERATVAHEILHAFGAEDKYDRSLDDFPPGLVDRSEIMRMDSTRLKDLRIGPLTAMEIGWTLTDSPTHHRLSGGTPASS